jgi:molecular chaperone GrpE (heat shock protein)
MVGPPYSNWKPTERKRLQDMEPQEARTWLHTRQAELADFRDYVQRYLDKRKRRHQHTRTDERYNAFQGLATDLLALLDEMAAAVNDESKHTHKENEE